METLNYKKLKETLIGIYKVYLENPENVEMKAKARELYNKFFFASPVLDETMQHAVALLVDLGWDLPNPPKPKKEKINQLIEKLKSTT